MRSRTLVTVLLMGLATLVVGATAAAPAAGPLGGGASVAGAGSLELHAALSMVSRRAAAGDCPPGTPSTIECHPRDGKAVVPSLGSVSESYLYRVDTAPAGCPAGSFKVLPTTGRFTVAGKGEIQLAVRERPDCHTLENVLTPTRSFTITGGSGTYAGASGSGTLDQTATFTPTGAAGRDSWVGTLVVPGLEFDVTPPTPSGAKGKTVRAPKGAKRARVTYKVTGRDDVDGAVSVSCQPRSGSRFKIGRTLVSCSAADKSGNTRTAKFRITVKARR